MSNTFEEILHAYGDAFTSWLEMGCNDGGGASLAALEKRAEYQLKREGENEE